MKCRTFLPIATEKLRAVAQNPQREAENLIAHVLCLSRLELWTHPEQEISPEALQDIEDLINRRVHHEPLAYLLGYKSFWRFDLKVTPDTLIPREETEVLVTETLERVFLMATQAASSLEKWQGSLLDLGTGSGAIALALASELPAARMVAAEQSLAALAVARENAQTLGLPQVIWIQSDWFENIHEQFDIIVSNPPYIAYDDPALENSVKQFEPASAYFAPQQGLADVEKISQQAPLYLKEGGWLLIEHGYQQAAAVQQQLHAAKFTQVQTFKDLNQHDRVTIGQKMKIG